ncbi:MAG: 30S ribosome-binding factor RbfA [Candidatus Omnitrophota bacterium]
MSLRMEKINSEIQKQIMDIFQKEVDDPRIGIISITRVETTSDLKESKVYYSVLDDVMQERVKNMLDSMNKFIRVNLAKRIRLKILPELRFILDDSIKYSVDIYKKIEELKEAENRQKNPE